MLGNQAYHLCLVVRLIMSSTPMYMPLKITTIKHLITQQFQLCLFIIIN